MTSWHQLDHAYGNAADVPDMLARLSPDGADEVWNDLWSCLCHQGTVYSASAPTLPYLLSAASEWPVVSRVMPLALAGAIVMPWSVSGDYDLQPYRQVVKKLHVLAVETIEHKDLDSNDFIHLLEAMLALEGEALWGRYLNRLSNGEFEGKCPSCGTDVLLVIGQYGFFAAAGEWVNKPSTLRQPLEAADAADLQGVGQRLHAWALGASQRTVAQWLLYVFGQGVCPACRKTFDVQRAIAMAQSTPS